MIRWNQPWKYEVIPLEEGIWGREILFHKIGITPILCLLLQEPRLEIANSPSWFGSGG